MFETKGDVAEWQMVYDDIKAKEVGDVITYDDLSSLLDRDFLTGRSPIYKATKTLEATDHRTLANVANVGYRVVSPPEHEVLARQHHKKGRRQLSRAFGRIHSADRTKLSPEDSERFDRIEENLSRQRDMIRRIETRAARTETRVERVENSNQATEARIARLEEALTRFTEKQSTE